MVVGDPTISTVADVVFGDQIVDVNIVLGAIRRHRGGSAPDLGQVQGEVGVDDLGDRLVQLFQTDVPADGPAQLVRADQAPQMPGGLRGAKLHP